MKKALQKISMGSTLADLSKADKQKVSRLVYKLVELGKEHDQALEDLVGHSCNTIVY